MRRMRAHAVPAHRTSIPTQTLRFKAKVPEPIIIIRMTSPIISRTHSMVQIHLDTVNSHRVNTHQGKKERRKVKAKVVWSAN